MKKKSLSDEYLENLMNGACFLGCGGGGSLTMANKVLDSLTSLDKKKRDKLQMVDIEHISDDDYLCFIAGVGRPLADVEKFDQSPNYSYKKLVDEIDHIDESKFKYVIPGETGAMNSLLPLLVCAHSNNDIKLVNADGAGRALPQLKMCTYALNNISCNPSVIANEKGKTKVLNQDTPDKLDNEIREIITSETNDDFKGAAILASFVMKGADIKKDKHCVKSSVDITQKIGAALRAGKSEDALNKIKEIFIKHHRKVITFPNASITNFEINPNGVNSGFDIGKITLSGVNWSDDMSCEIDFVNENIVIWFNKDNKTHSVWAPYMLCFIDENGKPLSNADIHNSWKGHSLPVSFIGISPDIGINIDKERNYFKEIHKKHCNTLNDDTTGEDDLEKVLSGFHGIEYHIPKK